MIVSNTFMTSNNVLQLVLHALIDSRAQNMCNIHIDADFQKAPPKQSKKALFDLLSLGTSSPDLHFEVIFQIRTTKYQVSSKHIVQALAQKW
jgi:hypothetical protein